ncbi:MAG TPA: phosphoadenylyl-sulfate reductase [Polyangiaceae bacterium]|nr:phosphoadenylyl-sulfate reductase [Polyangiaceae bacterium]
MHVTMVKKVLASGAPCQKCAQAEELLKARGLWEKIDEVVWAVESDPTSKGMLLANEHQVTLAPFFIMKGDRGEQVFTSTLKLVNELSPKPEAAQATSAPSGAASDLAQVAKDLDQKTPDEILRWGLDRFGSGLSIAFSGAEDVALIDMAVKTGLPFTTFCLDTGRLHAETYEFIERVRSHYGIEIQLFSPDPKLLEPFVKQKGLFSFYQDGHSECCAIRKVEPLSRALATCRAWVTGQRKDQNPSTRGILPVVQNDPTQAQRVKLNPLANWTLNQVWQYIRDNSVPYNPLHDQGFVSIGCQPCTRAPRPGEHERAGRWWWEESTQRECGLHIAKR